MKILIIGGFLGSGKTSVLLQLARHLVSRSQQSDTFNHPSVVILENEIGESGVDDKLLRNNGFSVTNLFSGCACCTISGELVDAVYKTEHSLNPEWLIVETTGVAYPAAIRENLRDALDKECHICILTDAARWKRIFVPLHAMLAGQIEGADTVLINKIDLAEENDLLQMEQDIHAIQPNATILRCCASDPIPDTVWDILTGGEML